ncbi:nitroreductase family deazaflavin-dependent oxidoreductase [Gordonia sp. TBRC 11910]|uniref:Nitroreductase family deazaflavin-dependent oxidoreductase n=1 Tax=Gordonia asplenii TaxID=2725283 RepID=A0A848KNU3_9ACTN|nr:nitroreductase family deazaflavin-dependent oxidoreductase [Gordonia asplenii]NMN99901.1 nitroreductase family deazaflavin-dependent oxidoreductase [Gordonia asplenii]
MAWPRQLLPVARWIRRPALRIAHAGLGFAEVTHRGRRSGREYRTPVRAVRSGDIIIGANFGADADWVRNVFAAQTARVRIGDDVLTAVDPRLVDTRTVLNRLPPMTRFILHRLARTEQCIVMRVS